jgi:hypothetical protein
MQLPKYDASHCKHAVGSAWAPQQLPLQYPELHWLLVLQLLPSARRRALFVEVVVEMAAVEVEVWASVADWEVATAG